MNKEYEYIDSLTEDERKLFIECFCCMIYSDEKVVKEEIDFLKKIGKMYNISEQSIVMFMKNIKKQEVFNKLENIKDRKIALQLVKELCYLANSDNGLDDNEIDFIIDVAERLNIENEKLKQINKWVLDKIVLLKTGEIILEEQ